MKHKKEFEKWFRKYQPVKDQDFYDLLSEPYIAGYDQCLKDIESRRCDGCKKLLDFDINRDGILCRRLDIYVKPDFNCKHWEPKE